MLCAQGNLGFIIPQKQPHSNARREISVDAIEYWRSRLKLNDLATTSKSLYLTLKDTHQADVSPTERFEILNLIRPTMAYVTQSLIKLTVHPSPNQSNEQKQINDFILTLNMEMFMGYKLILDNADNKNLKKNILFASTQAAMQYAIKVILFSYENYRQPPNYLWQEIYFLFDFAKSRGLLTKSFKKIISWSCRLDNLSLMFNQCILFALAQPFRVSTKEFEQLLYATETWASFLNINKFEDNKNYLYAIFKNSDHCPSYIDKDNMAQAIYGLELSKINDRLSQLIALKTNHDKQQTNNFFNQELGLSLELLQTLHKTWSQKLQRFSTREAAEFKVQVAIGISNACWLLEQSQSQNQTNLHDYTEALDETIDEVIDMDILPNNNQKKQSTDHALLDGMVIDQSQGGFCINITNTNDFELNTNELILLKLPCSKNSQNNYCIGSIRWLKSADDGSVYIGVQKIGTNLKMIQAKIANGTSENAMNCILIGDDNQSQLITPNMIYKTNHKISYSINDKIFEATLEQKTWDALKFQVFKLKF